MIEDIQSNMIETIYTFSLEFLKNYYHFYKGLAHRRYYTTFYSPNYSILTSQ